MAMFGDIHHAFRTLRHSPGFALTAIVSIALAIGANSAIFSMADGLILRPLPVIDASAVVTLRARTPSGNFSNISYADYVDFRDKSQSFDGLVAYALLPSGLAKDAATQPQVKTGFLVSGNFFQTFGVTFQNGRGFRPDEDQVPGRDAVIVFSHDLWKSEFGADPSVVGQTVRLNGLDFTLIGVAPESFTSIHQILRPAFYVPAAMGPKLSASNEKLLTDRSRRSFFLKGRLKSGVSIETANAEVASIARALEQTYPTSNRAIGAAVRTEMQARTEFDQGDAQLVVMLSVLAVVVLSIACANVANLMLNRARTRAREVAVRLAIGARRWKIVRQLMAESLIIAVAGGVLGLLIAQFAVEMFSRVQVPGDLPIQFTFQIDYRVLAFTLIASVASAVLFGLVPAMQATRTDLVTALKAGEAEHNRKRLLGRRVLVVVQVAGSMFLVLAAVQTYRYTRAGLTGDQGFRIDHRITMRFDPSLAGYSQPQTEQFYRTLIERAGALPGVRSVALSASLPMTTNRTGVAIIPEGYQFPAGQETERVPADYVTDYYFGTFAIPILAGRGFSPADRADSPRVAVVNEELARLFFNGNPIGKRLQLEKNGPWIEIVGMTSTGHYITAFEPPLNFIYFPASQYPQRRMTMIAETSGDPAAMAGLLRDAVRSIDPNMPIFAIVTMEELFEQRAIKVANLIAGTVGTLSGIGLVLALVGLYAVVAYQVGRRTREIGIRMALGAGKPQVMKMILKQAAVMALIGIGIGSVFCFAGHRALLAGIGPQESVQLDPVWVAAIVVALLGTTLLAAAIPARHASRIDPQRALRQE
jgi:predicted permease